MDEEPSMGHLHILGGNDDVPELGLRIGALETELEVPNDSTSISDGSPHRPSLAARLSHCVRRSITVPLVFLMSVLVAVGVILFCIFPASILLVVVVVVYYVCARDPIPFRVLVTALLGSEENGGGGEPARTVPEIHAAIVKRKCLGTVDAAAAAADSAAEPDQLVWKLDDGTRLLFSKPLTEDEIDDRDDAAPWLLGKPIDDVAEAVDSANEDNSLQDDSADVELGIKEDEERVQKDDAHAAVDKIGDEETGAPTEPEGNDSDVSERDALKDPPEQAEPETLLAATANKHEPQIPLDEDESMHACDICLLPFEQGQIVAWSHNAKCEHAYHLDCITDWLIKQKTCPNCRADYLRKK